MNVTEVNIMRVEQQEPLLAYVNIVLDDSIAVKDIKVIRGEQGRLFVSMPARKRRNGSMSDIVHPINSTTRKLIEDAILDRYRSGN